MTLFLTVLVGGRASVRNAAETFGLDYTNLLEALGKLLHEHDSRTHVRYLYTTDLSLSGEEIEEAYLAGDRGPPRDVKALGLLVLGGFRVTSRSSPSTTSSGN
ncbi:hypothetical protein MetMK1DRAFT_00003840 [Metallosphaera yellowstonensis MK1]|uniref:Uncharacterized protein n=1 Tax=Metallosphaera yellowstonensis MK1 TaxID=671065 RepID=H2C4U0_9CREN|nr:hypothetical protein MetMK1DRAFT_00003840 [Metallosphaera yellowstonensis MK1]